MSIYGQSIEGDSQATIQATSYWARAEKVFTLECSDNLEALRRIRQKASEEPCADTPPDNPNDSQLYFSQILSVAATKKKEMEARQWNLPFSFKDEEQDHKVREVLDKTCERAKIFNLYFKVPC